MASFKSEAVIQDGGVAGAEGFGVRTAITGGPFLREIVIEGVSLC